METVYVCPIIDFHPPQILFVWWKQMIMQVFNVHIKHKKPVELKCLLKKLFYGKHILKLFTQTYPR